MGMSPVQQCPSRLYNLAGHCTRLPTAHRLPALQGCNSHVCKHQGAPVQSQARVPSCHVSLTLQAARGRVRPRPIHHRVHLSLRAGRGGAGQGRRLGGPCGADGGAAAERRQEAHVRQVSAQRCNRLTRLCCMPLSVIRCNELTWPPTRCRPDTKGRTCLPSGTQGHRSCCSYHAYQPHHYASRSLLLPFSWPIRWSRALSRLLCP